MGTTATSSSACGRTSRRSRPWRGAEWLPGPVEIRNEIDKPSQDGQKITQRYPDRILIWRDPEDEQCGIDVLLLDVDSVQPIESLEAARARPTAAVLVGALHARAGNIDAARMAIRACDELPEPVKKRYIGIILAAAREPMRDILKGEVEMEEYDDPLWDIEKESGTYLFGLETGRAEGLEAGRAEGLAEGCRAVIDLILALLEARGVPVDGPSRALICSCDSLATLRRWAQAAQVVSDARALFDWQPPRESTASP